MEKVTLNKENLKIINLIMKKGSFDDDLKGETHESQCKRVIIFNG